MRTLLCGESMKSRKNILSDMLRMLQEDFSAIKETCTNIESTDAIHGIGMQIILVKKIK